MPNMWDTLLAGIANIEGLDLESLLLESRPISTSLPSEDESRGSLNEPSQFPKDITLMLPIFRGRCVKIQGQLRRIVKTRSETPKEVQDAILRYKRSMREHLRPRFLKECEEQLSSQTAHVRRQLHLRWATEQEHEDSLEDLRRLGDSLRPDDVAKRGRLNHALELLEQEWYHVYFAIFFTEFMINELKYHKAKLNSPDLTNPSPRPLDRAYYVACIGHPERLPLVFVVNDKARMHLNASYDSIVKAIADCSIGF